MALPDNPSPTPFILAFIWSLLILNSCTALFTRGGGEGALSQEKGAAISVALTNLLTPNKISTSKHYPSGLAFAEVHNLTHLAAKTMVVTRYIRWTEYCTAGPYESVPGKWLIDDFKATIPYIRPYAMQGYSWASVSNAYAFLDYYVIDTDNISSGHVNFPSVIASDGPSVKARKMTSISNFESPLEKTGFVDCPVWPFLLLSHDNGVWNTLTQGDYLTSPNERISVEMQRDCNLVLTDTKYNRVLWSSDTAAAGKYCFLRLQSDGKLAIYGSTQPNYNSTPVWSIYEGCGRGCIQFSALVVEDEGRMVIYSSHENKLYQVWSTNTTIYSYC